MLSYTGHPLLDVGIATLLANAKKSDPAQLTQEDLEQAAQYAADHYFKYPMLKLMWILFPNSGYTQYSRNTKTEEAKKKQKERQNEHIKQILLTFRSQNTIDAKCIFLQTPARTRVYREHIPLIGGRHAQNFYAEGISGLPVSGEALLALHFAALGGTFCGGRLLIAHSNNPELTLLFAQSLLKQNKREISLLEQKNLSKPDFARPKHPRSYLIEQLSAFDFKREFKSRDQAPISLTAYWLTNYGTKADIEIFHLPSQIIQFVQKAKLVKYQTSWQNIVSSASETYLEKINGEKVELQRNYLYEDLFDLPDNARIFLRRYFLRQPLKQAKETNPLRHFDLKQEVHLVSWKLLQLFLEEILYMDSKRIDTLRRLGDQFADYVDKVDGRLFDRLFMVRRYYDLSRELLSAKRKADKHDIVLFTFEDFVEAFEGNPDIPRVDWSLARDMILVRMLDQLNAKNIKVEELLEEAEQPDPEITGEIE